MAILRGQSPEETVRLASAAWDAGLELVEIPLQNAQSADALAAGAAEAARRGRFVGAGTITSTVLVEQAAALGARFTVAPGFDPEVAARSLDLGMPHLPGVATGSEVQAALTRGCIWLKAFPAEALGASWISAMRGPFPEARFVATGGINARNARQFLSAGAGAVSFGAAFAELTDDDLIHLT
ncbi:bifunctional 4-hydroxy-2-oxoglutarate aldolase/2-dehydro-3-deoxy-phosphogluconate aldolase [Microbacterium sp. Au-Mic1]|uniref:bifunctional 4-hydroxy-2-oxoglutarate aldolase/2-dehydro-3-deoxy-phosphogluconate aldolase n=1 Tax=Microbacterium sp. Au-Mic1 TaxID=2906457 RepID=UPI001E5E1420|nr:bifunctional 4-hydroxy-2-oxoglutarate aldolase/2-dehydro-3-deoxy-phosphogluconate aldolase [Microbacterium sp. Au-Mic1]MCE4026233.1 bifunctional 4-hydroxy-2-oxoglutarate aldolase/2-dehydro-3-deoxy-phosphogluconate aldolase [Microbacterium sp. Au-Mic1]